MSEHKKTAVIDLDGTLAHYDGWKGENNIGPPVPFAKDALLEIREWGWRLVVFTTRGNVDRVTEWLRQHDIPFDAVNSTEHNPPGTSSKPIGEVYFDDRDAHCVGRKPYDWHRAMKRVRRRYQPPLDTFVDDAAAWSSRLLWWTERLRRAIRVLRKPGDYSWPEP